MSTQVDLKNYTNCGVYSITNSVNGKIYIGSSKDIIKRKSRHFKTLEKNNHTNDHLQSSYNKYGANSLIFKIIIVCPPEDRIYHEQRLIDSHQAANRAFGYNSSSIAGVTELTPETRKKMSDAKIGIAPWNKGIPCSEETKKKIGAGNSGRHAWNKGIPCPEDVKKKLSASKVGIPLSEQHKNKIRESLIGKNTWSKGITLSKEHIEKIISSLTKSHCRRGHLYSDDNLYMSKGKRRCKTCVKDRRAGVS